jgi:T4 RnlA family RNA ligase
MKYLNTYNIFLENKNLNTNLPSYEECVNLCIGNDSPFYETKLKVEGFDVSVFNYRLATHSDFNDKKNREMRGICFVFNLDGTLFKRYILLEKFFNLNQVEDSMYSSVKDFTIKSISNKEDGSIATFIKLPNGKIVGKSKMGFDNEQAIGINRVYKKNESIKKLVEWSLKNNIIPIFEYVSPSNKIVLRYDNEELILLRLRDNENGKHLDIKDYYDIIGDVRIAPFEDETQTIDDLIERAQNEVGKEGWIITFDNGQMIKIKTSEYIALHGLLTDDVYRENILIGYILDEKIDDILGQIPEEQVDAHERIEKIISVIKKSITEKVLDIENSYQVFLDMGSVHKDYALSPHRKDKNFAYVMAMSRGADVHDLAKDYIREKTKRLLIAREFLLEKDPTIFFQDPETNDEEDN